MFLNKLSYDLKSFLFGTNHYSFVNHDDPCLYPLDLDFTLDDLKFHYLPFDSDGIPLITYKSIGEQYNATRIASYCLANYNRYKMKCCNKSFENFLNASSWFSDHDNGLFYYNFNWNDLVKPWISCMSQGEAISVLVRLYRETSNNKFLELASAATKPFYLSINNSGLLTQLPDGSPFLEEYPSLSTRHVLNGFLYALVGMIELNLLIDDDRLNRLINELVLTLENNISHWSVGKWSLYEYKSSSGIYNYSTPAYHNLHITLLSFIISNFNSYTSIESTIDQWTSSKLSFYTRIIALFSKTKFRIYNKTQR